VEKPQQDGRHRREGISLLMRRIVTRNRLAIPSTIVLVAIVLIAVFAPWVAPYDPYSQDIMKRLESPSNEHLMGNDDLGRDVLSRLIFGARNSLIVGFAGAILGTIMGVVIGLTSGYIGGRMDHWLMRIVDVMMSFPGMLLAILIVAVMGPGLVNLIVALAIWNTPGFARIVRGNVLSIKEQEFVEASRAVGSNRLRIMYRHILPNTVSPIIVHTTLSVATALLTAAGMSFLGLGVQPPTPEWGAMIGVGRHHIRDAPHIVTFPGLAIFVTVLAINFVGDALRDALDPRLTE